VLIVSNSAFDLDELGRYFNLDLSGVGIMPLVRDGVGGATLRRLPLLGQVRDVFTDRRVLRTLQQAGIDLFINCGYRSELPSPTTNGVYLCMFPQPLPGVWEGTSRVRRTYERLADGLRRSVLYPQQTSAVDSYVSVLAISSYVQSYVSRRWGRDSDLLYPPCEDMRDVDVVEKERLILSVGRFQKTNRDGHHKRHDLLVASFAKLTDLHEQGWRLCLAGSVDPRRETGDYIRQLVDDARGLPVDFRFDCSFDELRSLYNRATAYWHAAGFGVPGDGRPEEQEHFGITTVEAMSAGCIPIVFNAAGQRESVRHEQDGFLWNDVNELLRYTRQLAAMQPGRRLAFANRARGSAVRFGDGAFRERANTVFGELL
jgi:glycosyltransferase involved in cell wall biosynthesis